MDADGNWVTSGGYYDEKWENYNCYAYAIHRGEQPRFYTWGGYMQYRPGCMSERDFITSSAPIEDVALIVKEDLTAMGYSNISLSSTIPIIDESQELICVRKNNQDFHFMRYDPETNAWYHKPGKSAILKYNYTPSNGLPWYNEVSIDGVEKEPTQQYTSNIVFITYSKNQINIDKSATAQEYIQPGKDVFCELNFASSGSYTVELSSTYSFQYEIYDEDFDVISSGNGTAINRSITVSAGTYYLRMNFESNTSLDYVDVSIVHSTHSYTYTWLNVTRHQKSCACGFTTTASHVVLEGSFTDQYAICIQCRGRASVGVVMNSISELPHTANGSYILPNGVVVLVSEDLDAYMNGTLIFSTGETQ